MLDRNRGGSYLSVLISGAGLFGVFLFLTYYLQKTLLYSPVVTGLAFLPMVAMIVIGSTTSNAVLLPRFGPKPLVPTGMVLAALGMVLLAQLGVHSTYAGDILPALLMIGLGLGLIFAPSINTATLGVSQDDAGVASATVNSCQQVGGSIGTAFLNTIATTAVTSYLVGKAPTPVVVAQAAVHGYTVAFWWAAGIFAPRRGGLGDLAPAGRAPWPWRGDSAGRGGGVEHRGHDLRLLRRRRQLGRAAGRRAARVAVHRPRDPRAGGRAPRRARSSTPRSTTKPPRRGSRDCWPGCRTRAAWSCPRRRRRSSAARPSAS